MSKFVTTKWIEVNDLSGAQYSTDKNIRFKNPILKSDLCDYNDAYIAVVKRTLNIGVDGNNMSQKGVVFKGNVPFRSCMSKINNISIGNAEDLHIIMPMYNLLEYNDN